MFQDFGIWFDTVFKTAPFKTCYLVENVGKVLQKNLTKKNRRNELDRLKFKVNLSQSNRPPGPILGVRVNPISQVLETITLKVQCADRLSIFKDFFKEFSISISFRR